jgi:predicted anti-sigma-YlaC factor YlaD
LAEVDLEFLGRQVASVLDGQREMKVRLAAIEDKLAETATRDLLLRVLRSFEGQVEVAEIRTQLLPETLEARIKAAESRLAALEAGR